MQKTLLASVIIMSLSACDSDSLPLTGDDVSVNDAETRVVEATPGSTTDSATNSC